MGKLAWSVDVLELSFQGTYSLHRQPRKEKGKPLVAKGQTLHPFPLAVLEGIVVVCL